MNPSAWQANLHLGFSRQGERTLLSRKTRHGPLTVQRPFYPEGDVCHVYLLHPPGGVVGGDRLAIDIAVQAAAHALITTPAAGKFYRSDGRRASQTVRLRLEDQARLEWLPQETLFYQGTHSETRVRVDLMPHSVFIGWDIFTLGRPAAGEGFAEGQVDLRWAIYRAGRPLLLERLALDATAFLSVAGLAGHAMAGSLYAYPATPPHLHAVQAMIAEHPQAGATLVDDLLIVRVMDQRIGPLQECLRSVWQHLRPALLGRHASPPQNLGNLSGRTPGLPLAIHHVAKTTTMQLTPREKDKLLIFTAALLAERRKARGLKLNHPEAVAYLSAAIMEGARDGRSVAELMDFGCTLLHREDVMEGVPEMIPDVQVEATFPDGTKLVTVHNPIQ